MLMTPKMRLPSETPPPSRGRLLGLRAYLAHGTGQQLAALPLITRAMELLGEDDLVFRSMLLTLLGQIQRNIGDAIGAEKTFREAILIGERLSHNIGVYVARSNLIWILNLQGRLRQSIEYHRIDPGGEAGTGRAASRPWRYLPCWRVLVFITMPMTLIRLKRTRRWASNCAPRPASNRSW